MTNWLGYASLTDQDALSIFIKVHTRHGILVQDEFYKNKTDVYNNKTHCFIGRDRVSRGGISSWKVEKSFALPEWLQSH